MRHIVARTAVAALAVLSLVLGAWPGPLSASEDDPPGLTPAQGARRETVFESIRHKIHRSAADVPQLPMQGRRLLRPKDWPDSMTIGGVRMVRRIIGFQEGYPKEYSSVRQATGARLVMYYTRPNRSNVEWGPRYSWNGKRQLMQQIWYEPEGDRRVTHDYTYYRSGRLLGYSLRSEPRHQPDYNRPTYEFLSEFFGRDGQLIAVAYEKLDATSHDSLYAWMGTPVPFDDFRQKSYSLFATSDH